MVNLLLPLLWNFYNIVRSINPKSYNNRTSNVFNELLKRFNLPDLKKLLKNKIKNIINSLFSIKKKK